MTVSFLLAFSHGLLAAGVWAWSHRSTVRKLAAVAAEFGPEAVDFLNTLRAAVKAK